MPARPQHVLPHFYAENMRIGDEICALHGWSARSVPEAVEREMWDSVILDGPTAAELDMLEIRFNELADVVNKIFIVESNRTINGMPKGLYFGDQRFSDRFAHFQSRVVYRAVPAPRLDSIRSPPPDAWSARLRSEMNGLLRARASNTRRPPLVLFSAADELPAAHTLGLLRDCVFPQPLHLQLRRFAYAYAWPVGWDSWRAQVHVWDTGTRLEFVGENTEEARVVRRRTEFSHEMTSQWVLADAGWHCSYCYRELDDLIAKMQDEFGADAAELTPERIQKAICEGKDIFNTLPEAYSVGVEPHLSFTTIDQPPQYKDMLQLMNPEPCVYLQCSILLILLIQLYRSNSAVGVPKYIIESAARFKYLLPGGCMRNITEKAVSEDNAKELV
ncbi:glycosyltransferase family 17-domain-containing protein [Phellopilus nigrolimitatus]|nr:glycosyltransferase family 17-domain-containing protein [Phellopilus nigrolimitatus]